MKVIEDAAKCKGEIENIAKFVHKAKRIVVITGAGVSVSAGIPVSL